MEDTTRRKKARKQLKDSVNAIWKVENDEEEREIARRKVAGRKYCKNKNRGFVHNDVICRSCPDSFECGEITKTKLINADDQLVKMLRGSGYKSEYWAANEIDIEELRESVVRYATEIIQKDNCWYPELFHKIKNINTTTTQVLDDLVPEWRLFRQQKQKMAPESVFEILDGIRHEAKDEVLELVYGCSDESPANNIHTAWQEFLCNDFYNPNKKKIVTGLYKQLQEYCEQLKETFPKEFGRAEKDENHWPAKWMINDDGIRAMLNRFPHFSAILNILWRKRKYHGYQESLKFMEDYGLDERAMCIDGNEKERCCALLPENLTHEVIGKELGKSIPLVQKYMKAMCDIGVLKQFHQKGRNSFTVYSIGYWVEWENKYRIQPYLQQKKFGKKEAPEKYQQLVDFKVNYNAG